MEEKIMEPGNGKIFVGIPRERFYLTQFVDNRDSLLAELSRRKRAGGYFQAESHRVDRNRDRIVEEFLTAKGKPEWLMMIDTDMEHPIDAGIRLTSYGKPIVGALYFSRGPTQHTPFMFKELQGKTDKWGRPALSWAPMEKEVYDFLQNNNVPMRDGGLVINNPIGEPLIECDAVATGCIVIHRSVIEDMPQPIFEYRVHGNSEDLVFCKEAKERGWSIYCDMSTICGHFHWVPMGQAQFRMNYVNAGLDETSYTKRDASKWYGKFFKISPKKAVKLIEKGSAAEVGKIWTARFGDRQPSEEEVKEFYRDPEIGKAYIMELLHWNFDYGFNKFRQQLVSIRDMNVIEIGGGIGTVSLQLLLQGNNVLSVEVNSMLRDFIDLRYNQLVDASLWGIPTQLSVVSDEWKQNCEPNSFDMGVAIDVFEHLPVSELTETIETLGRIIKKEGRLVYHNNFQQQDLYPMHFDHSEIFSGLLEKNGFVILSDMEAVHG